MLVGCIIAEVVIGFILLLIRRALDKQERDEVAGDSK